MDAEIIVVDDYSRDATAAVLQHLQTRYSNLRLLGHRSNQGKGAAVKNENTASMGFFYPKSRSKIARR
jgi:glycosyltransferase involved in cell wall biosynthesis